MEERNSFRRNMFVGYTVVVFVLVICIYCVSIMIDNKNSQLYKSEVINEGNGLSEVIDNNYDHIYELDATWIYNYSLSFKVLTTEKDTDLGINILDANNQELYNNVIQIHGSDAEEWVSIDFNECIHDEGDKLYLVLRCVKSGDSIRVGENDGGLTYFIVGNNAPGISGLVPAMIVCTILLVLMIVCVQNKFDIDYKEFKSIKWYDMIVVIMSSLVAIVFFNQYFDMPLTSLQAYDLIDLTVHGRFFSFYSCIRDYAEQGRYLGGTGIKYAALYNIIVYIVLAIPLIPVYILNAFAVIKNVDYVVLLISDFTAWILVIIMVRVFIKFCCDLGIDRKKCKIAGYLLLSSPLIMYVLLEMGQLDALHVIFIILGIDYYIKNQDKRFALFFSIAIAIKIMGLFIFIPLILLKYKDIKKIFVIGSIGASVSIITRALFIFDKDYSDIHRSITDVYGYDKKLVATSMWGNYGGLISIFLISLFLTVLFSYSKKCTDENIKYYTIFVCLIVVCSFAAFVEWHPQWLTMIMPFIVLSVILSPQPSYMLWIDIALEYGLVFLIQYLFYHNVDIYMVNGGILSQIFRHNYNGGGISVFLSVAPSITPNVLYSIIVVSLIVIIYGFYDYYIRHEHSMSTINDDSVALERQFVFARCSLLMVINMYFIISFFVA